MSGKNNTDNFDDDFDFDALDGDDSQLDSPQDSSVALDDDTAQPSGKKKKSSGGLVIGVLALALLGGGSWYALQSGLVPGMSASDLNPLSSGSDNESDDVAQEIDESAGVDGLDGLPPMPDVNTDQADAELAETDSADGDVIEVNVEEVSQVEVSEVTGDDDVLTPMPDLSGESAEINLEPLADDLSELSDLGVSSSAERDGVSQAIEETVAEVELAETDLLNETEKTISADEDTVEGAESGSLQENKLMTGLFEDEPVDTDLEGEVAEVSDAEMAELLGEASDEVEQVTESVSETLSETMDAVSEPEAEEPPVVSIEEEVSAAVSESEDVVAETVESVSTAVSDEADASVSSMAEEDVMTEPQQPEPVAEPVEKVVEAPVETKVAPVAKSV